MNVNQGTKERALPVHGVERLGLSGGETDQARGAHDKPGTLQMRQDFPALPAATASGLMMARVSMNQVQVSGVRCQGLVSGG